MNSNHHSKENFLSRLVLTQKGKLIPGLLIIFGLFSFCMTSLLQAQEELPPLLLQKLESYLPPQKDSSGSYRNGILSNNRENSSGVQPYYSESDGEEGQGSLSADMEIGEDFSKEGSIPDDYDMGPKSDLFYTIKKGDTLGKISTKFYGSQKYWRPLCRVNGLKKPAELKIGKTIRIPPLSELLGTGKPAMVKKPVKITFEEPVQPPPAPKPEPVFTPPTPVIPQINTADNSILFENIDPRVILPKSTVNGNLELEKRRATTLNGLTGLTKVISGTPLGDGKFNVGFHIAYQKITRVRGNELKPGEDGTLTEFPMTFTYSTAQFETALLIPFKSYDVFAPVSLAFQSGTDSGLGDIELNMKFANKSDLLSSAIGVGVVFPTDDTLLGGRSSSSAWQLFGALSTLRETGGNIHLDAGYRSSTDNDDRDLFFAGIGFEYSANDLLTFMGEITNENVFSGGQSTDLTLGLRYLVKEGMSLDLFTPISLSNDREIGYDYKVVGGFQYKY